MSETPVTVPFVSFRPMERELDADLRGAFARVLDNSWYIGGREDAAFEKAFAAYCGVRHCIGCGNGLDALVLILKAMGIGPGDEGIAPYRNAGRPQRVGATLVVARPSFSPRWGSAWRRPSRLPGYGWSTRLSCPTMSICS